MYFVTRHQNIYDRIDGDPEKVGFYLAMDYAEDGFIQALALVFMSFTNEKYGFEVAFSDYQLSDILQPKEIICIRGIAPEDLDELSNIKLTFGPITTAGPNYQTYSLAVKNKTLLKKKSFNALLNTNLILLESLPKPIKSKTKLSIQKAKVSHQSAKVNVQNPLAKALFESEIDLHAHLLVPNPEDYTATEILILQLEKFDQYIDQALRLGVDRVMVIHGVGKGKLRNEIARRLDAHPFVKSYKNEFHPKYKFGATEVNF